MKITPVVYSGSSIAPETVRALLPEAQIMPPIQRGDLYRDRMLGFTFFVIIDGVFFNDLAISPREIIDVLGDGATIMGASSMGAIRAAECWPAGMIGVGSIYRLFRRGSLDSDEEVAVTFGPVKPHLLVSVPLVNVRYATNRLTRLQTIEPQQADNILSSAKNIFYANRNWNTILKDAGISDQDETLKQALQAHDLKLIDAQRVLKRAAFLLKNCPETRQAGAHATLFVPNSHVREKSHDSLARTNEEQIKRGFWQWLLASGRVHRYPSLTSLLPKRKESLSETGIMQITVESIESPYPDRGWESLQATGELDAAIFRYRAIGMAAREVRKAGWTPATRHTHLAGLEIAIAHGFPHWSAMQQSLSSQTELWTLIESCRDELSLAKCYRQHLFGRTGNYSGTVSWAHQ